MKVKTCVLVGTTVLLYMSAASKDVNNEGLSPGDRAPRIKSLWNERDFNFRNHSNRYTLLNFYFFLRKMCSFLHVGSHVKYLACYCFFKEKLNFSLRYCRAFFPKFFLGLGVTGK